MNNKPSVWKILYIIQKARIQKKSKIYKTALGFVFDKTIAIYSLIILGYILASLFIMNDFLTTYEHIFHQINIEAKRYFPLTATALPFIYAMQSFSKPGVLYSTSEFQLTNLPYDSKDIYIVLACQRVVKKLALYIIIASIGVILLPLSTSVVFSYVTMFVSIEALMKLPQWKLFQKNFLPKVMFLALLALANGANAWIYMKYDTILIGMIFLLLLFVLNGLLYNRLSTGVQWQKVTEASDYSIWNMWLISRVSKVDFKRAKQSTFFKNLAFRKRALPYTEQSLHTRLWQIYLGKNLELTFQLLGVLFILIVATQFINMTIFHIGMIVAIYVYTSVVASFFHNRFSTDIVEVLPWNLVQYKQAFFRWALTGFLFLMLPTVLFLYDNYGWWMLPKVLLHISVFTFYYRLQVKKVMGLLGKRGLPVAFEEGFGFISLVAVWYSSIQPIISIVFILLLLAIRLNPKMLAYQRYFV